MSKYQIQNCIHGPMLQGKGIIRKQALSENEVLKK